MYNVRFLTLFAYLEVSFFLQDLVLPVPIQAGIYAVVQDDGRQLIDAHVHCRNVAVRVGHFASKTFRRTHDVWSKVLESRRLDATTSTKPSMELLTDYVVCNSSLEPIRFGQVDTEENILLRPGECSLYAWRSQKARLQIRLCVDGGFWKWCDPFAILEGVRSIRYQQ